MYDKVCLKISHLVERALKIMLNGLWSLCIPLNTTSLFPLVTTHLCLWH